MLQEGLVCMIYGSCRCLDYHCVSCFDIWFCFQNSVPSFAANHVAGAQPTNLLGAWDGFSRSQGPGLTPAGPSIPRNASTPNLESKARDPFADLGE
jgi:hypothetical protein